jgi:LacI family transcriptional regulator
MATVSMVLNNRKGVSAATRRRVLLAADQVGYRRRDRAASSSAIGLLIERLSVPAYADPAVGLMVHGIESEAGRRGYHVVLATVEAGANELPAMVSERHVGGVVVLGGGDIRDDYIRRLAASSLPLVLADNFVDDLAVPCVLGDNETGAYLVTRHLIELGHRQIAILEEPRKYKTLVERREGYMRALDQAGIAPDPALVIKPHPGSPRKGYFETTALLELPASRRPTAIFAISDKTAMGALEALRNAGLRVPEDMAIAGFDDIAESAHTVPPLTTVRLPIQAIGTVAVQHLIERIEESARLPCKTVLYTQLVVRESSGAGRVIESGV